MKPIFFGAVGLLLLPTLFFAVFPAGATSFVDRPFPEVVEESPVMVRGKVGGGNADWGAASDGNKRIFTFYELSVSEVLKGKVSGSSLVMRELGGEKDGVGMQVSGASHFERGEDVVVMLSERNPDGTYDIRGLMMGKLNVELNESGNEILKGPALQGADPEGHTGSEGQAEWTLDALRDVIREQRGGGSSDVTSQNLTVVGAPQPSFLPAPEEAPVVSTPAPQLQNSSDEEPKAPSTFGFPAWVGLALGVGIFATGWIGWRRRRR